MTGIVNAITSIFTEVGNWISGAVTAMVPIFYGTEGLTFMGTLAIMGLAFSVVFLIIGIIQRFLKFGA